MTGPLWETSGNGGAVRRLTAALKHSSSRVVQDVLQFGHLVGTSKLAKDWRQPVVKGIGIPRLRNLIRGANEIAPLGMTNLI